MDALLRARDVAERLSISASAVYRLAEIGDLPCVRIGAAVRFDPADVDRYIERHRSGAVRTIGRAS